MTSFVNICAVKSAVKRYASLKIVNNKTKTNMKMCFISSMPWVTCGQEKGVPAKEIYFPRGNQNNRFYSFDKSCFFSAKHVIYYFRIYFLFSQYIVGHPEPEKNKSVGIFKYILASMLKVYLDVF